MKKLSLVLVGVLVLGLTVPVFAAEVTNWAQWHKDRIASQKVLIDARVEAGLLTQSQAELWKKTLDTRQEAIEANPESHLPSMGQYGPAMGFRSGFNGRGMNRMGAGRGHGFGPQGFGPMVSR